MHKIQGRQYQYDAVQSIFDYFESGKTGNPIIYVAGGGGKSVIIALLIERILNHYSNQRFIISAGSMDLVGQNYQKLMNIIPNQSIGIYSAGLNKKQPWCNIIYGGIQSMCEKSHIFGHRDLLLVDECQDLAPEDEGRYMIFINGLKKQNPNLKVIGFSATPWREKGGSLINENGGIFTDIIYEISQKFLTEEGYLAPLRSKSSLIQANLTGVNITPTGEFNLKKAETAINKQELTLRALAEVEILTKDKKNFLFFCSGVNHAEDVTKTLKEKNWNAELITGKTDKKLRPKLLDNFRKNKEKQALVNNKVLTVGTDLPNVDCIILWMATNSLGLYVQILSRGTRPIYAPGYDLNTKQGRLDAIANSDKPYCLVLCYGGNIERFGAVDLIQIPKTKIKGTASGVIPQKICPSCREPIHISVMECKCGYIFPDSEKPQHEQSASNAAIMSTEIKPERFTVARVIYKPHVGASGIPSLRVQYYSSFGFIGTEYVCFSHVGFARRKAEDWCAMRDMAGDLPKDTDEAYFMSENFKMPVAIFAKKSGKYMEIVGYEF